MILNYDHLHFPTNSIHSILQYVEFIFKLNFSEAGIQIQIDRHLLHLSLFKFWQYIPYQFKDFLSNIYGHMLLLQLI